MKKINLRARVKKEIFVAIFTSIFLMLPSISLAYEVNVHRGLTYQTFNSYEKLFGDKFSTEETLKAIQGSEDEDFGDRPTRHFYDPVNDKGLNVSLLKWEASKQWAQDTKEQAEYGKNPTYSEKYFDNPDDFSWDRAIFEYVHGDKERALETLGHILHLIQDTTVPAHVRNDDHLNKWGYEDVNLYERFTKNQKVSKFSYQKKDIVNFQDLNEAFDKSAGFTNGNFLSKDTVFEGYEKPDEDFIKKWESVEIEGKQYLFGFGKYERLIATTKNRDKFNPFVTEDIYTISDPQNLVLTDYWNILSKEAVRNGVGVIDLFFREVEKERKSNSLLSKNKSRAQKTMERITPAGFNLAKGLYGSSLNNKDIAELLGDNQMGTVANSLDKNNSNFGDTVLTNNSVGNARIGNKNKENGESNQKLERDVDTVDKPVDNSVDNFSEIEEFQEFQGSEAENNKEVTGELDVILTETSLPRPKYAISLPSPGFGGGGSYSAPVEEPQNNSGVAENLENQLITPNAPVITSPDLVERVSSASVRTLVLEEILTSTSVTFTGTVSSTNIIATDFSNATTSVGQNEDWSLTLENFNQGTTTIKFYALNQNLTFPAGSQTATSTATAVEFFVDSEAPDISLDIQECQNSISQTGCLLTTLINGQAATTTLNISWSTVADDFLYFTINQNGTTSTTTATTTQTTISGNQTYNFSVSATDKNGNVSTEETKTVQTNNLPVVINEIAWAGTEENTADEWIELYNNTDKEIDLSNWILYTDDGSPNINLENTIDANSYYLIERKNTGETDEVTESSIKNIPADLWVSFGSGLKNTGEKMILAYVFNNSTTTVDTVSKLNNWGGNGAAVSSISRYVSMERYDSTQPSGDNLENWGTNLYNNITNGTDTGDNKILGTPKKKNSRSYLISRTGIIDSNETLTKQNSPYLINLDLTINEGKTLTLENGVVIKFVKDNSNKPTSIKVNGTLITNGTEENPVVFTSFYDDEYGGDTNNDGLCDSNNASSTAMCPSSGNWRRIEINSSSQNSSFKNTIFRYGGYYYPEVIRTMVLVQDSDAIFENSIFENSHSTGLYLSNTTNTTNISNGIFRENNYYNFANHNYGYGLIINSSSPIVSSNLFENNQRALYIDYNSSASIDSNTFNDNEEYAVNVNLGGNIFSNNSGSNNGQNGILLRGFLTETNSSRILKKNSLPYILTTANGSTDIVASSTLAIDPGVVIKFPSNSKLEVSGRLEVNTGEGETVLFTSVNDDSDGNDFANDGMSTPAVLGQTGVFFKPNSSSEIRNSEFRYLKCGVSYESSPISLKNVSFKNNETAICFDSGSATTTLDNLIFEGNMATSTSALW